MKKHGLIWLIAILMLSGLIIGPACDKDGDSEPQQNSTVTDIDGNIYNTVKIGTQTWMVQNLKTTRYRNGDAINNITDNDAWLQATSGAYCSYENLSNLVSTYGLLYNWYAINDDRNIAPVGWRVANVGDWDLLIEFLGGDDVAGGKLKESGTAHWESPNTGATNESGFTALPGGERFNGSFDDLGIGGYWWTSTSFDTEKAYFYYPDDDIPNIYRKTGAKHNGLSVRCIKE